MARLGTFILVLAILGLSLFVAGCQGQLSTIKPTATDESEAATAAAMLPTATELPPTPEPTVEPPTEQPTDTATPVPPTSTPTELPPTSTPLPSATPTDPVLNMTATAAAEATVVAEIEAAVQATLDAQPTATEPPTLEPSATTGPDVEATTGYSLTQQAVLNTVIQDAVEATLEAQPTATEPPTYTPYPTFTVVPSKTVAPTEEPSATATADMRATARAEATAQASYDDAVAAAVEQTLTAYPTNTPEPTERPSVTPTVNASATARAETTAEAEFEAAVMAAVEGTLESLPTATAVPSNTPVPSATASNTWTPSPTYTASPSASATKTATVAPSATHTPDVLATAFAQTADAAELFAPTEEAEIAAMIAEAVEGTLAAMPSDTPVPSDTPEPTDTATVTPSATRTPSPVPSDTATPIPSDTPEPTATLLPPTQAITLESSPAGPTPDLFATATAQVVTATMGPPSTSELTATQIVQEATYAAAATASVEAANAMATNAAATASATPTAAQPPTVDFAATATQAIAEATAVAQSPILANLGLVFDVPDGWIEPLVLDANRLYLTDDVAQIFIYRGDSVYFAAEDWGIDPEETDLEAAADAIAEARNGTVEASDVASVIPVKLESQNGLQGAFYLRQITSDEWAILSLSAPKDTFDDYDAEVALPLIEALDVAPQDGTDMPTAVPTQPTMTQPATDATSTLPATPTASALPSILSPFQMTATQIIRDATQMAEDYVPPTVRPTYTLTPTYTPTHTPTATATPDFPATATLAVAAATAVAEALAAQAFDLPLVVPDGWDDPQRTDDNTFYLTDGTAKMFVSSGDAAFFAERWNIPEDEILLLRAAAAVEQHTGAQRGVYDSALQMVTMLVPGDATNGVVYLLESDADGWLIISASAPVDEFEGYQADVFDPFATSLAEALLEAESTGDDADGGGIQPSDVTLVPYTSETMGLTFDVPEGWIETIDEEMSDPEIGMQAILFFSSPEDAEYPDDTPVEPALAVLRFNDGEFLLDGSFQTPDELIVQMLDVDAGQVMSYDATEYPAARAVLEDDLMSGVMYALQVDDNDWVLVLLVLSTGDTAPLWDEVVVMPVVRSLVVDGPMTSP